MFTVISYSTLVRETKKEETENGIEGLTLTQKPSETKKV